MRTPRLPSLPDGWTATPGRPSGHHLEHLDIADADGNPIGILARVTATRRMSSHDLAREFAKGRPATSLHRNVDVWNVYRLARRGPTRVGYDFDGADQALRVLLWHH